jgi:hypothetical protein
MGVAGVAILAAEPGSFQKTANNWRHTAVILIPDRASAGNRRAARENSAIPGPQPCGVMISPKKDTETTPAERQQRLDRGQGILAPIQVVTEEDERVARL